jgi:hypothetical protein
MLGGLGLGAILFKLKPNLGATYMLVSKLVGIKSLGYLC